MTTMEIKFKNFKSLALTFDNNSSVDTWKKLFLNDLKTGLPIYRDAKKYTPEFLNGVYKDLCDGLGWERLELNSLENTVLAHKNLEVFLEKGFEHVPEEWDQHLHDFHYGLHLQENLNFKPCESRPNIQLEWFNDVSEPLGDDFKHTLTTGFGDIHMLYPHVGSSPTKLFLQNDHHDAEQTCRFHDVIKSGFTILTKGSEAHEENSMNGYKQWWITNAPEFVEKHGMEKLLHYAGYPVMGKVRNLDVLEEIAETNEILELEDIYLT